MIDLDSIHFAKTSKRLMANIIDNVLISLMVVFVVIILTFSSFDVFNTSNFSRMFSTNLITFDSYGRPFEAIRGLLFFVVTLIALHSVVSITYFQLLLSGKKSATYGMNIFNLKLVTLEGAKPSKQAVFIRTILFIVYKFIYLGVVSIFTMAFGKKHQGLHDMAVKTTVVLND